VSQEAESPRLPGEMLLNYTELAQGRVRTRVLGHARDVPELVVVQGMSVSDYLLPACAELARWTRVHLLDLPGYAGSGQPRRWLDVEAYGRVVADWLEARTTGPALIVGHSSGTQVAAWAGGMSPHAVGVALASPTIDPAVRPLPRLLRQWRRDGRRHSAPGLQEVHVPEWRRAGSKGLAHLLRVHLADRIEEQVVALQVPTMVLRASGDELSTPGWAARLASLATDGTMVEVPGSHAFVWQHPDAWSQPLRNLATDLARAA
jgi:pimeloyl-ACP methyl ester carboxylesterase